MLKIPLWTSWTDALDDNCHRVAQSLTIVGHLPMILLINASSAVIVASLLSARHSLTERIALVLFLWAMMIPLLTSWLRLRHRPPPEFVSRRRIITLIRYSGLLGIVWSAVMASVLPHESAPVVTFLVAGIGFLCIGCAAALSSLPLMCLAFCVPVLATAMVFSLTVPAPTSIGLVLMVMILAVSVGWLLVTGWAPLRRLITLAAENTTLLASLRIEIERQEQMLAEREKSRRELMASEQRFRALAGLSSDWYWKQDTQYRFVDAFEHTDGRESPFNILSMGKTRWEIGAEQPSVSWDEHRRTLDQRRSFADLEYHVQMPDGQVRWLTISGEPLFDADGTFKGYHGVGKDISDRKRAELALRESQERLHLALSASAQGLFDLDLTTKHIVVSNEYAAMLGYAPDAFRESLRTWRRRLHSDDAQRVCAAYRLHLRSGTRSFRLEYRERSASGEWRWLLVVAGVTTGPKPRLVGTRLDISERKTTETIIERLAYYDALTDLPNRRYFIDRLQRHLQPDGVQTDQLHAVIFIDLDHFKNVNDAHGHGIGDVYLAALAKRLAGQMREADIVARLGGDEFVVLAVDLGTTLDAASAAASAIAEKIRVAMLESVHINGHFYFCSASIGVTIFPKIGESTDDLLREADTAMFRAKAAGRNRVAFYEAAMHTEVKDRMALENDLMLSLDRNQIHIAVQSQVDIRQQVIGAELLVRWEHPVRGAISPVTFIPIAEDTGFILALGEWVLRQACMLSLQLGEHGHQFPLSINVSPKQFRQPDFVHRVRAALADTGAAPHHLIFEVTEGLLIEDLDVAISRMQELADMGIRFSIDDFGTGYSSLAYLQRLPLYELKIDRRFINDIPANTDSSAIVQAILSMAGHLHLRVVAEGVETSEQVAFLQTTRCDVMQGYFYSRPIRAALWLAQLLRASAPTAAAAR